MAYKSPSFSWKSFTAFSLLVATAPMGMAAPYIGWASDYTGSEVGTLALWKFDEPSPGQDASTSGKNLTFSSTGVQTGVVGRFGEAFRSMPPRSSSNNSYAIADESASLFNASELSVEFWFKPSFVPTDLGTWNTFFDKSGGDGGLWLRMGSTGALTLVAGNGTNQRSLSTPSLTWDTNTWYNIAVTFKNLTGTEGGDAEVKIFLNGEMKAEDVLAGFGNLGTNTQNWKIAQRRISGYGSVPGDYDNFRIANIAYDYAPVPEPTAIGLLMFGGGALAWMLRGGTSR